MKLSKNGLEAYLKNRKSDSGKGAPPEKKPAAKKASGACKTCGCTCKAGAPAGEESDL